MKSLVVIETEPDGAPLRIYQRVDANAARFVLGAASNPGWKEVVATHAPANLTLDVGHYHVVVEKFRDFNASEADMAVSPGHVHQLKANLSQGQFMAFLRVSSNVIGAHVWIDDKQKQHPEWGEAPHGELVPAASTWCWSRLRASNRCCPTWSSSTVSKKSSRCACRASTTACCASTLQRRA